MGRFDYVRYYCVALGYTLIGYSPIININDPLEVLGPLKVGKTRIEVPFMYTDTSYDDDYEYELKLDAKVYEPLGKFPDALVLFMPGFGADYESYEDLLLHLASHGFVTVGLNFLSNRNIFDGGHDIKAQEALATIAFVQSSEFYPEYKRLPVYTAGHSLGGKIAFYAAALSPKTISGVMALDPVNAGGPPCSRFSNACLQYPVAPNPETGQLGNLANLSKGNISSLIFRSQPDRLANPDRQFNAEHFYFGLNGKGSYATPLPVWYYDMGAFPHALYCNTLVTQQSQIVKRTMLAFLQQQVLGVNVGDYLTGSIIQKDIDEGRLLEVRAKLKLTSTLVADGEDYEFVYNSVNGTST